MVRAITLIEAVRPHALRQRCGENCQVGKWRPAIRCGAILIEIAFECAIDAMEFSPRSLITEP